MKIQFKVQPYQTAAVEAVLNCFKGQPRQDSLSYRIDPGKSANQTYVEDGFRNGEIRLSPDKLLENIRTVQHDQNLPQSKSLTDFKSFNSKGEAVPVKAGELKEILKASSFHLDVEMETGTGKTYVYIKTIFEMYERFGWSKFIIMVPSVAIREGVAKSFEITADHFAETYGKKARWFIYNSKRLHELESFSSDAGINVMIINVQAFNARGADNRRIYDELDDFQSRRPIDVISANRPILILDEPQKMGGDATVKALPEFKPLMVLRYSATHRTQYNKVYRLDALDAYTKKLVKKISVKGIKTLGLTGTKAYLYLEGIEISTQAPVARIEMEVKQKSGIIKRCLKRLRLGDNLFTESNELNQYKDRFTITQIDFNTDTVEFANGVVLRAGDACGDVTEDDKRRIQIRETIKSHFDKERELFSKGVKVLSLFFIDEVVKYRDYSSADEKGEYARIFEEEYSQLRDEYLSEFALDNEAYRKYLETMEPERVHKGYFSIDKKTKQLRDPKVGAKAIDSDDSDAYDLILRDKERLLSFEEQTRFIFSHSALREGWDNPNVFVMCMLKHSSNTISRRQEVGRGLRISVDKAGNRMDDPLIVHDVNVLTIVSSESYTDFVAGLQKEILEDISVRPRQASEKYFVAKVIEGADGTKLEIYPKMAKAIYKYLLKNDYIDEDDYLTESYTTAKELNMLAELPEEVREYSESIYGLIDSVRENVNGIKITDGRKIKSVLRNDDNFSKKEFKELWNQINYKTVYRVKFDSKELVRKCINALNTSLHITPLQYTIEHGEQKESVQYSELESGESFKVLEKRSEYNKSAYSSVKYDLLGNLAGTTGLTRGTIASIITGVEKGIFDKFKQNPESFLTECGRIINEQKASMIIEKITYDTLEERFDDCEIFTASQMVEDMTKVSEKVKKHIYEHVITDSKKELEFSKELEANSDVVVYSKLPKGFFIPTPVGNYNPDWAVSFKEGSVKHIYFVAETKGNLSSLQLRPIEEHKIECARQYFAKLAEKNKYKGVRYDVVDSFDKLMSIVKS